MESIVDKVAVITGASSGIGLGIAKRLSAGGASVVLVGRDPAAIDRAVEETGGFGMVADVTDPGAMKSVVDQAVDKFGKVDILVNNAGIGPTGRLAEMTRADWKWLIDSNVWSVINGLDAFLPILRGNPDGGHIVNTASISGMFAVPTIGGYAATKYAVVAISEALEQELKQEGGKVGISLFLPGPVRSNIHRSSRNRPSANEETGLRDTKLEDAEGFENVEIPWMNADAAGDLVVEAILSNRFYVWTHPEGTIPIIERFRAIDASIQASTAVIAQIRETGLAV